MEKLLSEIEIRVIGSLIEKEITTPEYYPMSVNSLVNACNQKSNREPVVNYTDDIVEVALNSLRERRYARMVESGGRVPKFKETFIEELKLNYKETAVLTVLMLRGPQTSGEIRSRSGRLFNFSSLQEIESTIQELNSRDDGPFIVKLERQAGMKERRYAHLLSGVPNVNNFSMQDNEETDGDDLAIIKNELENLKAEIDNLKNQFAEFRKQFD